VITINKELIKSKFIGALLGTAVGDAMGMPVEGLSQSEITRRFGKIDKFIDGWMPKGHYTDDTQLMIGVAESLIESKGFDGENMAHKFLDNFEAYRGYGPGTVRVLQGIIYGQRWDEAALHIYGGGSFGNGAAMRIAPVGVLLHSKPEQMLDIAEGTSRITHTHPLGIEGALLQAYAVGLATYSRRAHPCELDKLEFIDQLLELAEEDYYLLKLKKIKEFISRGKKPSEAEAISVLGVSVKAHESVPMALYCFLNKCDSFREAVSYAVNMGGDTDTLGAMTGALVGALHGRADIPDDLQDGLENDSKGKDYIINLGERLFELYLKL
jgi:poly(ADP-ribose) glycohydrolase ARH3